MSGTQPTRYYHFVANTLRDKSPIPANGVWISAKGDLELCANGMHASAHVSDALQFAPGPTLCLVELRGEILTADDKVCARSRRIIARFDATELLRADARASAQSVLKYWQGPVPQVVLDWLTTGDEQYRSAAHSAAESAARSATWIEPAARSAAWSAARSATRFAIESAAWSAAQYAIEYAAEPAARFAARSAVWSAARSAAWSEARDRLQKAVDAKFAELLK